jgi:hypothetical protein
MTPAAFSKTVLVREISQGIAAGVAWSYPCLKLATKRDPRLGWSREEAGSCFGSESRDSRAQWERVQSLVLLFITGAN